LALVAVRARRVAGEAPTGASPGDAVTLALFAALPLAIFLADTLVKHESPGDLRLVDLSSAHRLGPANAPVQIVVYSDFQCGFCRQLAPVLQRVAGEFPQEVALVYRHFPLTGHPRAFPAAVAAECAAEQGAFWKYHDKLFAESGDLDDARLLNLAAALGLDELRFKTCLHSEKPRRMVEANLREATELGLPGAPSVFINGRRLEGPLTEETLSRRIKELLPGADRAAAAQN
jgi:protein-disulfide isomerase